MDLALRVTAEMAMAGTLPEGKVGRRVPAAGQDGRLMTLPALRDIPPPPQGFDVILGGKSPIDPQALRQMARLHPNQPLVERVAHALEHGVDMLVGIPDPDVLAAGTNHESNGQGLFSPAQRLRFLEDLEKDLKKGTVLELDPQRQRVFCSPMDTRPKGDGAELRHIHNLSAPFGRGVNSTIPESSVGCHYVGPAFATDCMKKFGRQAVAVVIDVSSAFRLIFMDPRQRFLFGFMVNQRLFVHRSLPFGCSSSPAIWERLAQVLQWVIVQALRGAGLSDSDFQWTGAPAVFDLAHYVDDSCCVFASWAAAQLGVSVIRSVMAQLGVPLSESKFQMGRQVKWLGIVFDFEAQTVSVCPDRRAKLITDIDEQLARKKCSRSKLMSLLCKFRWACATMEGALCWTRSLAPLVHNKGGPPWLSLPDDVRADLLVWKELLQGPGLIKKVLPRHSVLVGDASGVDGGGFFLLRHGHASKWGFFQFPPAWHLQAEAAAAGLSSMLLEAANLTLAVITFAEELRGSTVLLVTDNQGLAFDLQNYRSKTPSVNRLICRLSRLALKWGIVLRATWMPRESGLIRAADHLSHAHTRGPQAFLRLLRSATPTPTVIDPAAAWQVLGQGAIF